MPNAIDWVTGRPYGALTPEHERTLKGLYSDDDFEVLSMTESHVGFVKDDLICTVSVKMKSKALITEDIIVRVKNIAYEHGWGGIPTVAFVKGKNKKIYKDFIFKEKVIKEYKALTPEHIAQARYSALTPEHEKQMIEDSMPMILSAVKGMSTVQLKHVSDAINERRNELNKEMKSSLKVGDIVTFLEKGEKWTGKIFKIGTKLIYVECTTPKYQKWRVSPNHITKVKTP